MIAYIILNTAFLRKADLVQSTYHARVYIYYMFIFIVYIVRVQEECALHIMQLFVNVHMYHYVGEKNRDLRW